MQNYPDQLRLRVREGEYDEPLERLFKVVLVLAVPGVFHRLLHHVSVGLF